MGNQPVHTRRIENKNVSLAMRRLSPEEEHIFDIAEKKYGKNDKNEIFFHNDQAILTTWNNGKMRMMINLSNWAAWLAEGLYTEDELKKTI